MVDDTQSTRVQDVLAANLRRLRIARRLSLSELARTTGVSKATLWGVESRRSNPTVDTLAAVADALEVSLGELLEQAPLGEVRVVRAAQAGAQSQDGAWRRVDSWSVQGRAQLAELTLGARQLHEAHAMGRGAWAHVYVTQGPLIAGPVERIAELADGDYAAFPADAPHVYEATRQGARALVTYVWPLVAAS
jgi:transcriptional regulator with XRE-family HTH domain